jgi:hypothetical protein
MKLQYVFAIVCLLLSQQRVLSQETADENQDTQQLSEVERGKWLVYDAVSTLINGEDPANSYKDLFIDTSKGIMAAVDTANELVTVDDMLRIFLQSVIILVSGRHPADIPSDFNSIFLFCKKLIP